MNELHDLLVRSTDRLEDPRLEQVALRVARRRRTRRRGAAAAAVVSAAAVTVVLGVQGVGGDGTPQPAAPTTSAPSPTPSPTTAPDDDPTAPSGPAVVDDPDGQLVDLATSTADPDVRVGVWRTCVDSGCGSIAVGLSLTTDGFTTRAVPDQTWRTIPLVEVAPSGDVLVFSWSRQPALEVVRPDGSVEPVRRTATPAPVTAGELVGGVVTGRRTTFYATDLATAVAHPVPVPDGTSQLEQTPSGRLRATTLRRTYAWSDDGGATWQESAGAWDGTLHQLFARSAPDVHVLVGGSDGATLFPFVEVRRLEDQDSWSVVEQPGDERAYIGGAAVLPDGRLLLDVDDWSDDRPAGLWASDGSDWSTYARVDSGAPFDAEQADVRVVDVRVDEASATIVAVGPDGRGAWVSEDVGLTWEAIDAR